MREKLKAICGQRRRFRGVFVRFGEKTGYEGRRIRTVLLKDITAAGDEMCDHVWFICGKQLTALDLSEGDVIEFDARVTYGPHGLRAFMAAHHLNSVFSLEDQRPWCETTWDAYNDALDRLDGRKLRED